MLPKTIDRLASHASCAKLETLIREQVMNHAQDNDLISSDQHSSVRQQPCVRHLLEVLNSWIQIPDAGGSVDATYMDFCKAFDTVLHPSLPSKVAAHSIQGRIWRWIQAFLSGRQQKVVSVNGFHSTPADVTSGIPQGSVLRPVLFVMYINDLPHHVFSAVKVFAGDTKLYTCTSQEGTMRTMQEDLNRLQQWSRDWLLSFHPDKCSVLKLGSHQTDTLKEQQAMERTTVCHHRK